VSLYFLAPFGLLPSLFKFINVLKPQLFRRDILIIANDGFQLCLDPIQFFYFLLTKRPNRHVQKIAIVFILLVVLLLPILCRLDPIQILILRVALHSQTAQPILFGLHHAKLPIHNGSHKPHLVLNNQKLLIKLALQVPFPQFIPPYPFLIKILKNTLSTLVFFDLQGLLKQVHVVLLIGRRQLQVLLQLAQHRLFLRNKFDHELYLVALVVLLQVLQVRVLI
jgi:hypothetical protein